LPDRFDFGVFLLHNPFGNLFCSPTIKMQAT
jgi:hypothetical protein